ncbi:MAG: restriction endonuclease subunit S, partial [Schlesneria sp.]
MTFSLRELVEVLDSRRIPVNSEERAKRIGTVPYFGATGQVGWIDDFLFDEEILLIGEDGAPFFDKSKPIAYIVRNKCWVNNHAHVIRANVSATSNLYLKHFLDWFNFNGFVNGTTRLKLTQAAMNSIPVRLAPLAEQSRIVEKLELLLAKVSSSQKRLSRIPILLKRFRQSVLAAACSGKLTADWRVVNTDVEPAIILRDRIQAQLGKLLDANEWMEPPLDVPDSWEWVKAQDLCRPTNTITYGVLKPVWVTRGVPTVRVQDMKAGKIAIDAVGHCSRERADKFSKTSLEVGDLLIAKDGATLGKTAFVPPSLAGGNITQHVLRFPITSNVSSTFVRFVIDSKHGQDWMRQETKGVALPGVNVGDFRRMPVPLPPRSEQDEIIRRVDKLFTFADQIELRLTLAKSNIDRLTQSILAKAFKGELVPTEHD